MNWADPSIDYTWEKDDFSENAKLAEGLKDMNYKEPGTKQSGKSDNTSLPIPGIMTCHIGFGLQRTLPDPEKDEIIVVELPVKTKGK